MSVRNKFVFVAILLLGVIGIIYQFWQPIIWGLIVVVPITFLGILDMMQTHQAIRRNFPVIGHGRYLLEKIRPEIMQYFVETDTEGRPINRIYRSLVYRRAKKVNDTVPFGTQMDVYSEGYEWMDFSMYAKNPKEVDAHPRVMVGGPACKNPYPASLMNISAMSYGALSKTAIMALNKGAKIDDFAHNTGEGGISPYHKKFGGDLIWQIGTGYFGSRTPEGEFCPITFKENASLDQVKMIEIKLSQGAKPGHGGILPAIKNTAEIANIRHVEPYKDVHSPPGHSAFSDAEGLMHFIQKLRELSGGKPIGFKLCVGRKEEFSGLCKAMLSTGIMPDFITVDGGEGGTGAAPVEFSNSLGMPLRDALAFVHDTLVGFELRDEMRLIASGKIISGFHIAKTIALGADMINSARGMMMALGCIQALECNRNTCPVGVATQDKSLTKGLDVEDKSKRVANFHHETLHSFAELMAASGLKSSKELNRSHIFRRISMAKVMTYEEIYPYTQTESLIA
ncbi:MAG: FMN-binding glutamate synthase family protein [Candidatus Marinimicrobia bacterium]|jgi:glutamate synthase domain-containing protein 2|nr:FMN-binding glutamate synthase family protein [Candidatus Neomarinimicrobiota bacterium]MBT3618245.1 FMN-binding glutamate synthase family protein [Candidatus Neomarinimicrobiota bacterium]MBT3829571.1 FMN-binding glutamate synthase family protein [Candidatus Neomarinimicrobiota bacterium]MBT3997454.1 FMN-binding glutamate synthase family protein [Candidatus Neomarinimicrobiota bacterium]MBT4569218.1 FMN-binding glutamate synthase family protein [Candidatus Neomarinimicrobiota bacterium]